MEEGGTKARGNRGLSTGGSQPHHKRGGHGQEQSRSEERGFTGKDMGWSRRREMLGKLLGRLRRARLGIADLRAGAAGGTEPGDLGFHGKQRGQQAEHGAQGRQSRMPDHEAPLHMNQFSIGRSAGRIGLRLHLNEA